MGIFGVRTSGFPRKVVLLLALCFFVFPVAIALVVALSPRGEPAFLGPIAYAPSLSLGNLREAIHRGRILTCFFNSASVALLSAVTGTALGFPAAYVLARSQVRWKPLLLSALVILRMQPKMPAMAAYYHLVSVLGLLDTAVAVALVRGGGVLLSVWLMKAAIDGVPRSLEQAALLDGFTPLQVALRVTVPLSAPGIAAAFLLEFASAWNSFLLPLLFMNSERRMTVSLGIDRFLSGYGVEPGPLMAFTLLVSLPLLLVFPRMLVAALAPLARGYPGPRKADS